MDLAIKKGVGITLAGTALLAAGAILYGLAIGHTGWAITNLQGLVVAGGIFTGSCGISVLLIGAYKIRKAWDETQALKYQPLNTDL